MRRNDSVSKWLFFRAMRSARKISEQEVDKREVKEKPIHLNRL